MSNSENDIINELIAKHLAGETSAGEQRELSAWISENDENRRHYDGLKKAFDLAQQHFSPAESPNLSIDVEQEWNHFAETIRSKPSSRRLLRTHLWLRIAASLLLAVGTGAVLYFYTASRHIIYQTAENKETVSLPDGSRVTLNRNTLLSYDADFGAENRTVQLEGEAFFEVEPDADKPFIILTDQTLVRVLGTSFNVNAHDSLPSIEVIVQTGVVSFQEKSGEQAVELSAGEKGIYSKADEQLASAVNNDVNFLSWNTQRMVFVEIDLRSVFETLEKTYQADISVGTAIPPSCLVTVTFENQTLESVLKVLESTLNLKYTISGNKVEVIEAGC